MEDQKYYETEFYYLFFFTFPFTILIILLSYYLEFIPKQVFTENYNNFINLKTFSLDTLKIFLLNSSLFLGYLFQIMFSIESVYRYNTPILFFKSVIYGPFMEEVIYRFVVFAIIKTGQYNNTSANIISSFIFGFSKFYLITQRYSRYGLV